MTGAIEVRHSLRKIYDGQPGASTGHSDASVAVRMFLRRAVASTGSVVLGAVLERQT